MPHHWNKTDEMYSKALCIISYNCMSICDYLRIKITLNHVPKEKTEEWH